MGLRFVPLDTPGFDQFQRQLSTTLKDLYGVEIIRGNIIEVEFGTANTDQSIEHGLSRAATGYLPVSLSAAGSIYTSTTVNKNPMKEIILKASVSSLSAKIWIF